MVSCFSPPLPMFSHRSHFQLNFSSAAGVDGPPSVHKGNTARCHRPLLKNVTEKSAVVSLSVVFIPPPLPIFSHDSLFQLICYSVGRARRPPSVDKVNNSPPHPSPLASHVEKAVLASFPLLYIFLPTISNVFSLQPFSILLLCLWQCQLPSLSLEGK